MQLLPAAARPLLPSFQVRHSNMHATFTQPNAEPVAKQYSEISKGSVIIRVHPDFVGEITPDLASSARMAPLNNPAAKPVTGRGATVKLTLASGRVLVVREYRRGGYAQLLAQRTFLRPVAGGISSARPFVELEIVEQLRLRGVNVPLAAFACVYPVYLGLCYRGAIATEEIANAENMLDLVRGDTAPDRVGNIAQQIGSQARRMLDCGVCHADFHLGNMLCAAEDTVFLIDFDKAFRFSSDRGRYEQVLLARWKRSVQKHTPGRPEIGRVLIDRLSQGLGL